MPFTLSHAAAVLPGLRAAKRKGALVAAGLVAGSLAPDVPFFAESLVRGVYRHGGLTHRWWAAPTLDVAVGAGLVAGWYGLWREPLRAAVPGRWNAVAPERRPAPGELLLAAGALAAGAATHLVWDSFTHHGRAGVRALPVLEREVAGVPLHTALQYGTSLLGLGVLARYAGPWRESRRGTAALLAAATLAGAAERVLRGERGVVDEACFGAGAGLAVGAAVLGLAGVRRGAQPETPGTGSNWPSSDRS
ncbi:DUF4184 family protein [Kitasatospora sp. YST-16]|uniref:DUF4184 family protein n=1 Tax=Kitasatospora sp. YST-16 TaxID=2998080 RepID=UPI0022840CD9|nr:DUF4184 family protein [Kitasatospora sp. YST-16]WAL70999.1 DUF4184 family protein [Kitasatospora sp. YST-16]WNW37037.1 DUF4184 family protein [Streptomyces sp. Li-HN-5-13]